MNNIQNYGMTNYQVGFQANNSVEDVLKQKLKKSNFTKYFRKDSLEYFPQKIMKELEKNIKEHFKSGKKLEISEKLKAFESILAKQKPIGIMSPDGDMLLIKNFDSSTKEKITELFEKGLSIKEIEAKLNLIRRKPPEIK